MQNKAEAQPARLQLAAGAAAGAAQNLLARVDETQNKAEAQPAWLQLQLGLN